VPSLICPNVCHQGYNMVFNQLVLQGSVMENWHKARLICLDHAFTTIDIVHSICNIAVNLNAEARRRCGQGRAHSIILTPNTKELCQITCGGMCKQGVKLQANWDVRAASVKNTHKIIFLQALFPFHVKRSGVQH